MATVELSVDANLAGLRAELGKIPGLTADQARLMTAELNKSIKASERAAKAAATATTKAMEDARASAARASASVADVGDKFGHVGSSAGKLAGALDLVTPGLGDAARTVADLADVGEVGAAALGTLGVAVTAITATVGLFALSLGPIAELIMDEKAAAQQAAAQLDALAKATETARAANDAFASTLEGATDELKIALGVETEAEQRLRKRTDAIRAQQAASEAATREEIAAAKAVVATNEAIILSALGHAAKAGASEQDAAAASKARAENERLNAEIASGEARLVASAQATEDTIWVLGEKAKADAQVAANEKRRAAATEARAKREQELAEIQRRAAEEAATMAQFVDKLASVEESAMTESQRLALEIKRLNQEANNVTGSTEAAAGAVEILRARQQALADADNAKVLREQADAAESLRKHYEDLIPSTPLTRLEELTLLAQDAGARFHDGAISLEEYRRLIEGIGQASAEAKAQQEGWYATTLKIAEGVNGVAQTGAQLFESLGTISEYAMDKATSNYQDAIAAQKRLGKDATDAEKKRAKDEVEERRNALIKAFMVDKAIKMSQALINTALAVTSALTAGPVAGPILATAAAAAGAVQVAAISSEAPKFHAGGVVGQPDEMTATVRRGEAVLSPAGRAALGDNAINDLNAGVAPQSAGQAIQVVYGHKAFDYFVRSHLRTRMTLPRALGKGTRTGQRG